MKNTFTTARLIAPSSSLLGQSVCQQRWPTILTYASPFHHPRFICYNSQLSRKIVDKMFIPLLVPCDCEFVLHFGLQFHPLAFLLANDKTGRYKKPFAARYFLPTSPMYSAGLSLCVGPPADTRARYKIPSWLANKATPQKLVYFFLMCAFYVTGRGGDDMAGRDGRVDGQEEKTLGRHKLIFIFIDSAFFAILPSPSNGSLPCRLFHYIVPAQCVLFSRFVSPPLGIRSNDEKEEVVENIGCRWWWKKKDIFCSGRHNHHHRHESVYEAVIWRTEEEEDGLATKNRPRFLYFILLVVLWKTPSSSFNLFRS